MIPLLTKYIFNFLDSDELKQSQQNNNNSQDREYKAIIGDIGGTNVRIVLIKFNKSSKNYETIKRVTYKSNEINSFEEGLRKFFIDVKKEDYPELARIGTAGAVFDNKNKLTNIEHWPVIDGDQLAKDFNIKSFKIYNDFEIASYGVINLDKSLLVQINDAKGSDHLSKSVVGAGTGLGMSFIGAKNTVQNGEKKTEFIVYPGEGGHASFSANTQEQQEFYNFLRGKYPEKGDYIGLEYGLVGPAIPYFYEFCKLKYPQLQQMSENNVEKDPSIDPQNFQSFENFPRKEVFTYGKLKKDKLCQKVVDLFLEIYGQTIGDICLRTLCYGGVYLCGGISISLKDYILENKDTFMKEYKQRKKYLDYVFDKIPVYIVMEEDIGLNGAFYLAQTEADQI